MCINTNTDILMHLNVHCMYLVIMYGFPGKQFPKWLQCNEMITLYSIHIVTLLITPFFLVLYLYLDDLNTLIILCVSLTSFETDINLKLYICCLLHK